MIAQTYWKTSTLDFMMYTASDKAYRLVYDKKKVCVIIEGTDKTVTSTRYTIEEYFSEKEALKRIENLSLNYQPLVAPEREPEQSK